MRDALERFFAAYADDCRDGKLADLQRRYETPAIVVQPPGAIAFERTEEFSDYMAGLLDQYRARGMVAIRHHILLVRSFNPGLVMADVHWAYLNANGQEISGIYQTYVLRPTDEDGFVILAEIAHTEVFQRPI